LQKENKGYLTIAQNTKDVDYLRLAYLQAMSIKATQKINTFGVIVDAETKKELTANNQKVFDYVIDLEIDDSKDDDWKFRNEWKVWWLTPFKETIKVESDILFNRNIDHWWSGLQQKDVCVTSRIVDYEGVESKCTAYRKLFVDNNLPMLYSGFTYFRYSTVSQRFFVYVRLLTENWEYVKNNILVRCVDTYPTTDVLYALAAVFIGVEKCTNPALEFPTFVHLKGAVNRLSADSDWTEYYYSQINNSLDVTVGFTRQMYPLHYYVKTFATEGVIQKYERHLTK